MPKSETETLGKIIKETNCGENQETRVTIEKITMAWWLLSLRFCVICLRKYCEIPDKNIKPEMLDFYSENELCFTKYLLYNELLKLNTCDLWDVSEAQGW